MFNDKEVQDAIIEMHLSMNYLIGNRALIKDVKGLSEGTTASDRKLLNDTISQVTFKDKLTNKQTKYINNAFGCGKANDIFNIAKVMNALDCDFDTGAEAYFKNDGNFKKILKGNKVKG